jgi:hypothetical protein
VGLGIAFSGRMWYNGFNSVVGFVSVQHKSRMFQARYAGVILHIRAYAEKLPHMKRTHLK